MPKFTFVQYEGDDQQIAQLVAKLVSSEKTGETSQAPIAAKSTSTWDAIATRFERIVSRKAAEGRDGQKRAILAWLRADGKIELSKLWKASGVKAQHDYSGIGGSLSKNMKKAGGPRDWWDAHVDRSGNWIYTIIPELIAPLQKAFSVK